MSVAATINTHSPNLIGPPDIGPKGDFWLQFFDMLGPEFPSPAAPQEEWEHFIVHCSRWPTSVFALGVLLALSVLCCSVCGKFGARGVRRPPTSAPAVCLAFLSLVLIAAGTFAYWETGTLAWQTTREQLNRAISDAGEASSAGTGLSDAGTWILQDIHAIPHDCIKGMPAARRAVGRLRRQVLEYKSQIDAFNGKAKKLLNELKMMRGGGSILFFLALAATLAPTAAVLACCAAVTCAVFCSNRGRCSLCCVRCLGPVLFTPTIVLVAAAAAFSMEAGIVGGSFCSDVDLNTLAYAQHALGSNSEKYKVAQYYIRDVKEAGSNPLLADLNRSQAQLAKLNATVNNYSGLLGTFCPAWKGAANLTASLSGVEGAFEAGRRLLAHGNVHPYYEEVVHEDTCQLTLIGLGWLFLLQAVGGLVCLPWLVWSAIRYLKAWNAMQTEPFLARQP